jgi:hypothetical protein
MPMTRRGDSRSGHGVIPGRSAIVAFCALAACTTVRQPDPPPPADPVSAPSPDPAPPRAHTPPNPWNAPAQPAPPPPERLAPLAAPVVVETLNGDPKGPKREEITSALQKALPSLAPCLENAAGSVGLSFDASPGGRAQNIKVTGASPATERCVSSTLAQLKLPSFEGAAVPLQFPLNVFRPSPPPPAPTPAAPTAPPATATSTGIYAPPSMATSASAPPSNAASNFIQP